MYPALVEEYYSGLVYPHIAYVQRLLFGWIPFSVGDLLYAFAGIWLIIQVVKWIKAIHKRAVNRHYLRNSALLTATVVLGVYCAFNILWGLNYNRYGIEYQLKLDTPEYDSTDLIAVTSLLAKKMNELQPASVAPRQRLKRKRRLFAGASMAYKELQLTHPVFNYHHPSIKPSIYSYLGNYLGFTGYYNPFTGEAQVNTTVPLFVRPFTTCHEVGHQLGYAKESEANFSAYLSASASHDTAFLYSVYFEMYAYAARYLYYRDSIALKAISATLSEPVKSDIKELRAFLRRYDTPIETAIDRMYSQFLKANEQPSGKMSYNEVVGMLIAYYRKEGRI